MAVPDRADDAEPADLHVGAVLRQRRKAIGMSQETLAARLNVSAQQIQKYETARCRISASKLFMAARALEVPPAYFFLGLGDPDTVTDLAKVDTLSAFINSPDGQELAAIFMKIPDRAVRREFIALARAVSDALRATPAVD